mmetsp:Transcript_18990/g.34460  ORF Transcript_18990/g.34460 Transcript_18990/m.34460 type:complete len:429 (-) Transcript_18990:1305-2591(-)|eukprot:CAMPEP_0204902812 /NCGR_PEP_ID=MMETSP1397-20131031/3884_1 /ASSEMBLY_ACC=CAM_ASM_000891 /TAXON_ID=49980 /ORGANISM="Climacostomum Climacostomum virens, Strain Stock W-24" /LENGTH=428 /DNA_ID=CAMNT_0052071367 /DNA_START=1598 /DNA_END=2884 /DNA_ORIENTATION=-
MKLRPFLAGLIGVACPVLNSDLTLNEFKKLKERGPPFFLRIESPTTPSLNDFKLRFDLHQISSQQALGDKHFKDQGLYWFDPSRGLSSMFYGRAEDLKTWVDCLQDPITFVTEEAQMLDLLRSRSPRNHTASVIVAYIAPEDTVKLEKFKLFVSNYFCNSSEATKEMFKKGLVTSKFAVVSDSYLAHRMFILPETVLGESKDDLLVYKYYQPHTVFHRYLASDFRDADALTQYDSNMAYRQQELDVHIKQLRLKLNRSKYVLANNPSRLSYGLIRKAYIPKAIESDVRSLARAAALEDLVLLPWTTSLDAKKSLDQFWVRRNDPQLVIALQDSSNDVDFVKQAGLHKFARDNENSMMIILGSHNNVKVIYDKVVPLNNLARVSVHYYKPDGFNKKFEVYRMPEVDSVTADQLQIWLKRVVSGEELPIN